MTNHAQEIIDKWDNGEIVWSIEMGGLGPGYEQALQMAAIEGLRELAAFDGTLPDDPKDLNTAVRRITDPGLNRVEGLSGAQAGAATWVAYKLYSWGEEGLREKAKESGDGDRMIQISKHWPSLHDAPDHREANT